ncbi:MAG TPA: adenylate/guanylate cyclase domain-containing protein [Actinomycetota bacterium]|nr:adenylate/guanylate cyclase domain-containing protein [Actinomycetota bacterium]
MSDGPLSDLNTQETLTRLLDELGEHPERIEEVSRRIEAIFQQDRTVMVLDMSGFTRATQQGNIISFLLSISQMRRLVTPVVRTHGGIVVRAEHDNLTCLFDRVSEAVAASRDITERLQSANVILPSDKELYASVGIGHGPILNIENEAIFGNEVNLASKLGEDIGNLGDVLLTEAAYQQLDDPGDRFEKRVVSVSGLELAYYAMRR